MTSSGRVFTLLLTDASKRKVSSIFSMDFSVEMHELVIIMVTISMAFKSLQTQIQKHTKPKSVRIIKRQVGVVVRKWNLLSI